MNKIKTLREELNITQSELAQKLNLSVSIISSYERGERKPSIEQLQALSDFFNVSIDYLLNRSQIRNPEKLKDLLVANSGGLNFDGLDIEDLKELQRHINYIKKIKKYNY